VSPGVQIATHLAEAITRLFDESGATLVERYAALDVARALVPVSAASVTCSESPPPDGQEPAGSG